MLQAVVGDHHVHIGVRQQQFHGANAIRGDGDRTVRPARDHRRLVAAQRSRRLGIDQHRPPRVAAVASGYHARLQSPLGQPTRKPDHQRRLAGAASGDVADHDNRRRRAPGSAAPAQETAAAATRQPAVEHSQRPQQPRPEAVFVPRADEAGRRRSRQHRQGRRPTRRRGAGAALELRLVERRVGAALRHQGGVVAGLDDAAFFHHGDQIGLLHGGQPVRDDDGGAALHHFVQRRLHMLFGDRVQRRGGFVENQDRRVLQQRPGDGDALPLSAGEQHAVVADHGVDALRHGLDEGLGMGAAHGIRNGFRPRTSQAAVGDVVGQGVVEEGDVLRHKGDLPAQARKAVVGQRLAVEQDAPAARLVEARDQARQGGLSGAGAPDQRHGLAGFDVEGDVAQHGFTLGAIGERDVLEANGTSNALHFVLANIFLLRLIELREDARGCRQAALQAGVHVRELLHRIGQHSGQPQKRRQVSGGHAAAEPRLEDQEHQHREGQRGEILDRLRAQRLGEHHLQVLATIALAGGKEPSVLVALAAEDLHLAVAGDRLRSHMGHVAHGILDLVAQAPKALRGEAHDHPDKRRDEEERERKQPVHVDQGAEEDDHLQAVGDDDLQRVGGGIAQLRGGEGEPRHQVALCARIEEAARHQQQPLEQMRADDVDRAEGNARQRVFPGHRTDHARQRKAQHQQRKGPSVERGRRPDGVHDQPEGPGEARLPRGREQEADDRQAEPELLIGHVAEQPSISRPVAPDDAFRRRILCSHRRLP